MTQTPDSLHGHNVAGQSAGVAQRIVGRNPGAEQRRGIDVGQAVRNRHQRFNRSQHVLLIAAVVADAGNLLVLAVAEIAAPAFAARAIMSAMPANTDPLPLAPRADSGSEFVDHARDFMARNARIRNAGPRSFHDQRVTVAHPAGVHPDANLSRTGLRNLALHNLKTLAGFAD